MRGNFLRSITALAAVLMTSVAWGGPVTWTLQNVLANGPMDITDTYGDGLNNYSVTGSFVYDADTNTFSDVDISTPFETYSDADLLLAIFLDDQHLKLDNFAGESLGLSLLSSMTNAGGTIALLTGFDAVDCVVTECGSLEISDLGGVYYLAGSITTAVPTPAAAWLFASALGLLGWMEREVT